jgi:hypothetical protein
VFSKIIEYQNCREKMFWIYSHQKYSVSERASYYERAGPPRGETYPLVHSSKPVFAACVIQDKMVTRHRAHLSICPLHMQTQMLTLCLALSVYSAPEGNHIAKSRREIYSSALLALSLCMQIIVFSIILYTLYIILGVYFYEKLLVTSSFFFQGK